MGADSSNLRENRGKLSPGAEVKPVPLTPRTQTLPTLCGLMRRTTISRVGNTLINYSTTGDFITSKLIEVSIDNSM